MSANTVLYILTIAAAFLLSWGLTPLVRFLAVRNNLLDTPATSIKTHKTPTPSLGGVAIAASFLVVLTLLRFFTSFPNGTLRNLRGIFIGGLIMLVLGVIDDMKKPKGLSVRVKFFFQIVAALAVAGYGVRIFFVHPDHFALALSVLWVVGVANALNIIDIMDGFAASQAAIAALGFLLISFPSEALYVNFAAAALMGAALGFLPHNMSDKRKIFMGDSGSLFMGFMLAAVAMGASYGEKHNIGIYAPLLVLAVPIYDTFFVAFMRLKRGCSPFMGSKDHYALRLEKMGMSRRRVVVLSAVAALTFSFCAFLVTKLSFGWALVVYAFALAEFLVISVRIAKIKMHDSD